MPASYSNIDYNPKEVCPRAKRKQPKKNKNIFSIPNPKVFVPEQVERDNKDPEKEKKQQNIAKLKRQLA